MPETYSVLVLDMAHTQDPEGEVLVQGFPSVETATEYARRRVRASVEELRQPEWSGEELRRAWFLWGEDALVIGGEWKGIQELDAFIEHPATKEECDWQSLQPRG